MNHCKRKGKDTIYSLCHIFGERCVRTGVEMVERWNMNNKTKRINSDRFVALARTLKQ